MNNRYKTQTDFFSIFNAITDINGVQEKTLTQNQITILMVILSNVNQKSGEAFPSQENIRKRAGISSDTTYYKAFKPLVEKGWIIQRKRFNASACYSVRIPDDIWNLLITVSTESVDTVSTESVDTVSTESVELTTNINNKYITSNINIKCINEKEKNEKDHNSFTNVQELGGLTTNDASIEATIQNNKSIFNYEEDEPIYNYNTNEYENITDDNEQSLSLTELMDMNGADEDSIQNNPYAKEWIVDEILSIIDYTTANKKVKDNILYWLEEKKHLIYYFRRELNENSSHYDWMVDKIDNKTQRLNTIKSMLLKECQPLYNRNHESNIIEIIDDVDLPSWCLY